MQRLHKLAIAPRYLPRGLNINTSSLFAELLQAKYKLVTGPSDNENCGTDAETQQHKTSATLLQRQGILQHLEKFKQQAAAIKATAAAVQEWFEQQQEHHAEMLPADALRVLNKEAEKGLLHLLSTGLIPSQLELSPGLCEGPEGKTYGIFQHL